MFFVIIIALNFLTTTALCGIIFEIVQNSNDARKPVAAKIEAISDSNVSLSCKIIDSANKEHFDDEVVWCKRRKGLGCKPEIPGSANLSFIPIKFGNRGTYFCASFKYNLHKIIRIVVKPLNKFKNSLKQKRRKRADVNSYIPSPNTLMYHSESTTDKASGNLPIPGPTNGQHNHWSHEPYTLPTEIKRLYKENQNQLYDYSNSNYKSKSLFNGRGFSYAGVIAAVVGVILIVGALLYRLMKRFDLYAISPERISEVEPACQHPTCGQYCTFPGEENVQNHYHSVHNVSAGNGSNHSIPVLRVLPSLIGASNSSRAEENPQIHTVDLPPSYDNSVKNCDKYDMPPSYSEALSYMAGNRLPILHPVTQSCNQNVSRDT